MLLLAIFLDLLPAASYSHKRMDDEFRSFLDKFAEIERRVRKLLVDERSLRDEAASLEGRLSEAVARVESLERELESERDSRRRVQERLDALIQWLEGLSQGSEELETPPGDSGSEQARASEESESKGADQG